jgi:hypothetical protein
MADGPTIEAMPLVWRTGHGLREEIMSDNYTAAQVVRHALEDRLPGAVFTERDKLRIGRFDFDLDKLSQQIVDDLVEADYIAAVDDEISEIALLEAKLAHVSAIAACAIGQSDRAERVADRELVREELEAARRRAGTLGIP